MYLLGKEVKEDLGGDGRWETVIIYCMKKTYFQLKEQDTKQKKINETNKTIFVEYVPFSPGSSPRS